MPWHKCMHTTIFCPDLNLPRQGWVRNIAVIDLSAFDCDESKLGTNTIFACLFPLVPPMYINKSEHLPKTVYFWLNYIYNFTCCTVSLGIE